MIAKDLTSEIVPPLKTTDTGAKALAWMEEFKVSQLPIVNHREYLGLISDEDILNLNKPDLAVGEYNIAFSKPFVFEYQHIYDVIKLVDRHKISLMPVLDSDENYLGVITMTELVQHFSSMSAVNNSGGIIILELNINDYMLSEIAHIVESNDSKILSSYITSHPDSTRLELTLKINNRDLSRVLAAFYRYNYTVTASYSDSDFEQDLKKRYDSLMNYLNT